MSSRRLFPVPVCGSGTAEVESLPSYIHRLAYKHGIFVGELLRYSIRQVERDRTYCGQVPVIPNHIRVHDVLRRNKLASGLIDTIQHMTRQNLEGTIVSIFNGPLTMSRGELCKGFRWCPECFREAELMGDEAYFKLVWQFRAVLACPIHRSPLLEECSHCGCTQTSYIKRFSLDRCQDCGISLSNRKTKLKREELARSWQDIGRDVLELVSDLSRFGQATLPPDGIVRSLEQLFDYYWTQQREDEFYRLLDRDQLLSAINNKRTLCLNAARKVAFRLGISLYDLLSGNAVRTTPLLDFDGICLLPPSFLGVQGRVARDHAVVLQKLQMMCREKPRSLKSVARDLNVSVGYLEYRFPVQVQHIVRRYQSYLAEQQLQKRRLALEKALRYFVEGNDTPKSRKRAYRAIREETGLPKFMLKEAIQQVYQTLNV